MNTAALKQPITLTLALSVALHALLLFGIGIALPDLRRQSDFLQPLEVVLVNARSASRPTRPDALAQNNLDGGGNTEEDRRAASPLPVLGDGARFTPEQSARRAQQLEQEARQLMTQVRGTYSVPQESSGQRQPAETSADSDELVRRSLEIARLEAQIDKDMSVYQKMPRKKFIGARTQEYRFAQYVEDWRNKVERIGNLNYPEAARRQKIYGSLQLTVSIRADGSVDSVEVSRPSGQPILDAAAQRIVRIASPFLPFPPDIRKDTDIISITRTWTFTPADTLESK